MTARSSSTRRPLRWRHWRTRSSPYSRIQNRNWSYRRIAKRRRELSCRRCCGPALPAHSTFRLQSNTSNSPRMLKSRSKDPRFWWPLPLAVTLWVILIWAFGFFLTSPKPEAETQAPIQATFVELPEEKPEQKSTPAPKKTPKLAPPVKPQPQPKPRPQPRLAPEKQTKQAKPAPEQGTAKSEARADQPSAQKSAPDSVHPKDLLDDVRETRERRSAGRILEEEHVAPETTEREPSEEELRMANVMRNLREPGASGIFQII